MFERKNQNILSEHFNKMVDHEGSDGPGDSDVDFITLKRADHELEGGDLPDHDYTSKRKAKMANSKKAAAKSGARGTKLVFDDEGQAHELYEMKSTEDVFKGADAVKEAGRQFAESERSKLREADVQDKAEAKEKKKEKKRKRKERENEVHVSCAVRCSRLLNTLYRRMATVLLRCWLNLKSMDMLAPSLTCLPTQKTSLLHHLPSVPKPDLASRRAESRVWRKTKNWLCSCYEGNSSYPLDVFLARRTATTIPFIVRGCLKNTNLDQPNWYLDRTDIGGT